MSDTIIRVENLSKKYQLNHKQSEKYVALRDVLANRAKQLKGRLLGSREETSQGQEDFWALKDVSFEVKRGDRVGIIGRNGAGKSTLLKVLSRITEPTNGKIEIYGRIASLLEVGTGFHPELTGRENIFLNGAILGMSKAEIRRKFDEIVAFAEIEFFLDTPVKRYSSGMYVRLAFSVAAHLEPEILVVDEVLAVGDVQFQKKCLGKMEEVSTKGGRTVLFVSHNLAAVQQLTKIGLVLHKGKLCSVGKVSDAVAHYLDTAIDRSVHVYEVENQPRQFPDLSQQIKFLSLELNDCPTKIVTSDESIQLKICVKATRSVDSFRFSMTLFRIDGTPVGSFFTDEKHSLKLNEKATYVLTLQDLRLAPNSYYFGCAVGIGNPRTGYVDFDIIMDVLHFEVMPPEGIDETQSYWFPDWGNIRFLEPCVKRVS